METALQVSKIGNYYGGLWIQEIENKCYWIIENYDTNFYCLEEWEEIPKYLYDKLLSQVLF